MELEDVLFWCIPIVVAAIGILGWRISKRAQRKWLRYSTRAVPVFLWSVSLLLVLFGFVLNRLDEGWKSSENYPSPDGHHVARLSFITPGALGEDMVMVHVRKNWFHAWEKVYEEPGTKDASGQDAEVRWLDNQHLLIRYPKIMISTPDGRHRLKEERCEQNAAGVLIVCEGY